jgi:peptide-methionine (S)-S-oxide reductase
MFKACYTKGMQTIVLGGGCFWCLEGLFQLITGIADVEPGYAGGDTDDPTYGTVSSGKTGHAEVVRISFDPSIVSLKTILEVFWSTHDPTTLNKQGADEGPQYRSIVLYTNDLQKDAAQRVMMDMQQYWSNPIVTEIVQLTTFYSAELYHKNYFVNNPDKAYCQLVINPKIAKFKQQYVRLLQ